MRKFAIVIEQGPGNYSTYSPDLPGCITTGRTVDEVKNNHSSFVTFRPDVIRWTRGGFHGSSE